MDETEVSEIICALLESVDRRYELLEQRYHNRTQDLEKRINELEQKYEEEIYHLTKEIDRLKARIHDVETQLLFIEHSNLTPKQRKRF